MAETEPMTEEELNEALADVTTLLEGESPATNLEDAIALARRLLMTVSLKSQDGPITILNLEGSDFEAEFPAYTLSLYLHFILTMEDIYLPGDGSLTWELDEVDDEDDEPP